MELRRLNPDVDEPLYREAFHWDKDAPAWYKAADKAFCPSLEEFLAQAKDDKQADIGIFNPELCGLISVTYRAIGIYEAHLWAKRRASLNVLYHAGQIVMSDLFSLGMQEGYIFVAQKNLAVRRLCGMIGLQPDGAVIYKGSYKGKVTKWLRYSVRRSEVMEKAA